MHPLNSTIIPSYGGSVEYSKSRDLLPVEQKADGGRGGHGVLFWTLRAAVLTEFVDMHSALPFQDSDVASTAAVAYL